MTTAATTMTEQELLDSVVELAHLFGWRVAHFRPARTAHGWRTPVTADGAGWPDLTLVRERIVFAELKSARGRLSVDQQDWLHALGHAGAESHVWHPTDWTDGTIERVLRGEP
ncbi:MAG TPA: VRR-NUC domain-containing protein [Acidimicrobiales bacterium]|nr:VRR-NUC domain-containing protein [Acidimicrobiales bacterium]HLN05857.1 VRR-NUC domain-containing protein [Acidimicrobiales bacterium]